MAKFSDQTFTRVAANVSSEPKVTDAAVFTDDR